MQVVEILLRGEKWKWCLEKTAERRLGFEMVVAPLLRSLRCESDSR